MKRRQSARPVVVEIKRTRTSASSSTSNARSSPTSTALWRGTPMIEALAENIYVQDALVREEGASRPASQPARRILPSLIPMYVPSAPQQEELQAERTSPLQRPKRATRQVQPAAAASDFAAHAGAAEMMLRHVAPGPLGKAVQLSNGPTSKPGPVDGAISQKPAGRVRGQPKHELRRGEFWKRRLPRACW